MRNWKDFFGNLFSKQFENGGVTGRDFIDEARLRFKDTQNLGPKYILKFIPYESYASSKN